MGGVGVGVGVPCGGGVWGVEETEAERAGVVKTEGAVVELAAGAVTCRGGESCRLGGHRGGECRRQSPLQVMCPGKTRHGDMR